MDENWSTVFQTPWFSVRRRDQMHVIDERNGSAGAAVLPIFPNGTIWLVRQYRESLGRVCLEAPRGFAHDGESAEGCAKRELSEETGIRPEDHGLTYVGRIAPNSGLLSTEVALFLSDVRQDSLPRRATGEVDEIVTLSMADLIERVRSGEVTDGITIALVFHALLRAGGAGSAP